MLTLSGPSITAVLICQSLAFLTALSLEDSHMIPQLYPEALLMYAIIYVHADLQSHNIVVKVGQLSGIINGENLGWLPCHW